MIRITDMRGDLQAKALGGCYEVTTCRGQGHIVAAPLRAAQLVTHEC